MSTAKKRRGRPKGSGIDDTVRLHDIAARIAVQPNLKPTTAIKAMGITDPSSIRRLRDKYKKFAATQRALRTVPRPSRTTEGVNRSTVHEISAIAALAQKKDPTKYKTPISAPDGSDEGDQQDVSGYQQSSQLAMETPPPLDNDWVATWCSSNLEAMADVMDAQLAVTRSMLSVPYFAMAVRQQLALNAVALSVLPPGYRHRTLH